jgi:hypothetical protein
MSRRFPVLCVAAVLLASSGALFADPPDVMTLSKPKVFGSLNRAPVRFTHKDHMSLEGVSCLTCHHKGDTSTECATCHVTPGSLQQAFHGQCITCHDTEKRRGRVTGPRTCGECHAWSR